MRLSCCISVQDLHTKILLSVLLTESGNTLISGKHDMLTDHDPMLISPYHTVVSEAASTGAVCRYGSILGAM